ncbi:MAG: aspartyl protease family protein [Verrucomicrobia bacterium]|nr:aspartyl protease family protein [Verrucomicrobiota bacterium]
MPIFNVYPQGNPQVSATDLLAVAGLLLGIEVTVPESVANALTLSAKPLPKPTVGTALVDTGATSCCIEETVVQSLGLQPVGQVNVSSPNGPKLQNVYVARMTFPGSPIPTLELRLIGVQMQPPGGAATGPISLIGRDILRQCVLVYNGPMGSYTMAF